MNDIEAELEKKYTKIIAMAFLLGGFVGVGIGTAFTLVVVAILSLL